MNPIVKEMILELFRTAVKIHYADTEYGELGFAGGVQLAGGVIVDLEDDVILEEVQSLVNKLTAPDPTKL